MAQDWFSEATQPVQTQQSPQQGRVRPIFTAPPKAPDPIEQRREQRADEDQGMQREKFNREMARDERVIGNQERDLQFKMQGGVNQLRDDFGRQPSVADYRKTIAEYSKAMKSDPTPQGDLSLIYAFAKIMDPGSVVREGEQALITNTSPMVQQIAAQFGKQVLDGGTFTDEGRARLRNEITRKMAEMNRGYIQTRGDYAKRAEKQGLDPFDVIGSHEGDAFAGTIRKAQEERGVESDTVIPTGSDVSGSEGGRPGVGPGERGVFDADGNMIGVINAQGQFEEVVEVTPEAQDKADAALAQERDTFGGAIDALGRGIADTATLGFADEIAAGLGSAFSDKTYQQELARQRQIDRVDADVNPWARFGGQVTGGIALPTGVAGAMRTGGLTAGAARAGMEGAAYGGAYGFGSGEDMPGRTLNAFAGAAGGGALGYGIGRAAPAVSNAFANRAAARQQPRNAILQDAQAMGVDVLPADVGGAMTRRMSAGAVQMPVASGQMVRASETAQNQMGNALSRVASKNAPPLDASDAGEAIRAGAKNYADQTSMRGGRLYDRAKQMSRGVKVKTPQAIAAIDANIAELKQAGEVAQPVVKEFEKFRRSLNQQGGITIDGLRNVRTAIREQMAERGLRGSDTDRRLNQVMDTAAMDMETGLRSVGKGDAADAFKTANEFWKKRVEEIDDVLEPLIGKSRAKSGEKILETIEGMARSKGGDARRLSRVFADISPREAEGVRATIIQRLGEATPGQQGAEGGQFSASTFLTNWNKMSERGKGIIFKPEHRADLDRIARLAEAKKQTQGFSNTSQTAGAVNAAALVSGAAISPPLAIATLGSQYLTGKILSSPTFAKWLARAPRDSKAQAQHVERLGSIAAREPAISAEIIQLQDYLRQALSETPGKLAAGQEERDRRPPPPQ